MHNKITWLVLIAALPACGPIPGEIELFMQPVEKEPIINGEACSAEVLNTAIAIIVEADIQSPFGNMHIVSLSCTGTLIAPDVVLTAAHCLDASLLTGGLGTASNEQYYVSFETDLAYMVTGEDPEPDLPADAIEASSWIAHPDFDIEELNSTVGGPGEFNDIGLIFLSTPVTTVLPEVVITAEEASQLQEGVSVQIAGWGQQTVTDPIEPPPAGTLGIKQCATSTVNELGVAEMQIGAGSSTSRKCHGDSGGPSYLEVTTAHSRTRRVVGITSHAYDETDCAQGGLDTRVDVWLTWIEDQLTSRCSGAPPERSWCDVQGIIPPSYYDDCECNTTSACQTSCICDPDCGECTCDTTSACQASCGCDPDCGSSGGDGECACNTSTACQASCPCDPNCSSSGGSTRATRPDDGCNASGGAPQLMLLLALLCWSVARRNARWRSTT